MQGSHPEGRDEGPSREWAQAAHREKVSSPEGRQDIPEAKLAQHWPEESSPVPRDAEPAQVSTRERAVRPKEKGSPAFKGPSSPWPARGKKEEEYDVLEHCSHCPILLPLPVLKQHEGRRLMSRRGIGQMRGRGLNPSAAPNGHCPMDWQALVKVLPM
ncbi:XIAP-associated factor 1 isoform X8 [Notamacropus eugenii]|uniref:XIAP-associated factor 1 isoform X8 n=1 Tax=Notamacropus eugenii TaxID=9315 RepID=UPI003B67CD58